MFNTNRTRGQKRLGAAAVEFGICAPVLVGLLFGATELSRAVMVQHSAQEAAQAGCRIYSNIGTSKSDAEAIIGQAMAASGISTNDYTISYDPPLKADVDTHLEQVKVTVSIDFDNVAWLPPSFLPNAQIYATAILPADMEEEYDGSGGGGDTGGGDTGGGEEEEEEVEEEEVEEEEEEIDASWWGLLEWILYLFFGYVSVQ